MSRTLTVGLAKQEGTACQAYYLDVKLSSLGGARSTGTFKARIDTGADITCIPSGEAKKLMPLILGKPVLIRGHDGSVERARTHLAILSILDEKKVVWNERPSRGFLLTDSSVGLIGMDILGRYKWKSDGNRFTMESR